MLTYDSACCSLSRVTKSYNLDSVRTVRSKMFRARISNCTNLFRAELNWTSHRIFAFVILLFGNYTSQNATVLVMARYSHKRHDTISHKISRYDTICDTYIRYDLLQVPGYWPSGDATVVGDREVPVGGWPGVPWSPGLFSRATVSTGCQTIAAVETLHSCYCLAAARPAGGRTAQIFSDCAITKYLSLVTAFTVNTSTHPGGRAITAN